GHCVSVVPSGPSFLALIQGGTRGSRWSATNPGSGHGRTAQTRSRNNHKCRRSVPIPRPDLVHEVEIRREAVTVSILKSCGPAERRPGVPTFANVVFVQAATVPKVLFQPQPSTWAAAQFGCDSPNLGDQLPFRDGAGVIGFFRRADSNPHHYEQREVFRFLPHRCLFCFLAPNQRRIFPAIDGHGTNKALGKEVAN